MKLSKKYSRYIAILITITIVVSAVAVTGGLFNGKSVKAVEDLKEDEQKVVEEISNMTGAKAEDIINLRLKGKTWNEILELLKSSNVSRNQDERDRRSELLAQTGLDDDFIVELETAGFTKDEITEARMIAERVEFNLKEITSESNSTNIAIVNDATDVKEEQEERRLYSELAGKFNLKKVVSIMLKLESHFDGYERVLDEYIYALQIGIDLENYLTDQKAYEKEKEEKSVAFDTKKIITAAGIEAKLIEKLKNDNTKNKEKMGLETINKDNDLEKITETPKSPLPEVTGTKPKNPRDEVMNEINEIKNKSLSFEGR